MPSVSATPPAQRRLIGLLLALLLIAQIDQPYPEVALLQHIPTMLLIVASPWLLRRWPLSTGAVACIVAFLALHTLGGRYAYSNVPYDDWARALTGATLSDTFGWTRNHYDRLVHFAFGALSAIPVAEVARLWPQVTTANLAELTDIAGYRQEFLKLFGFGLAGIDYDADIEPHVPLE